MCKPKLFAGVKAYLIRENFEPDKFTEYDSVLKEGGATVAYHFDPTNIRDGDCYIHSPNLSKESFTDIIRRGCRIIGPLCLTTCTQENKPLPTHFYTCCHAMEGIKVLMAGFEDQEEFDVTKIVMSMSGEVVTEPSPDVSFVIVKNVSAAEYKWALNDQKPAVSLSWLHHCFKAHQLIPHDSYLIPPFSGLHICLSDFPAAEREELENLVLQNGGNYHPELTRACTHFICVAPEGDSYKAARRLGNNVIVSRTWLNESVSSKACLDEKSYIVQGADDSDVFEGKFFCFGKSIPKNERLVIVEWIRQGSGMLVDDADEKRIDFMIESHGRHTYSSPVIKISTHWIRSCIEDGKLHDIRSHVIYSPMQCHLPLPGFRRLTFCVSQYDEKDRNLLRNLCFVLGSTLVEKLTQKVTHLLCIYPRGRAYMAASEWGIPTISCDWIYACVRQGRVVLHHPYSVRADSADTYSDSSDSETMVVGYEEDFSGRQMIIDRVLAAAAAAAAAAVDAAAADAPAADAQEQ